MKRNVHFALLLALSAATLSVSAIAQNSANNSRRNYPQTGYAAFYPDQSTARLQPVDWDERHRCDGDHDRDDRHCRWRDRDGDRFYPRGSAYSGGVPYAAPSGWYDARGRWHPAGWFDRHGRWHAYRRP